MYRIVIFTLMGAIFVDEFIFVYLLKNYMFRIDRLLIKIKNLEKKLQQLTLKFR